MVKNEGQGRGDYNWERVGPSWLKFLGRYLVFVVVVVLVVVVRFFCGQFLVLNPGNIM